VSTDVPRQGVCGCLGAFSKEQNYIPYFRLFFWIFHSASVSHRRKNSTKYIKQLSNTNFGVVTGGFVCYVNNYKNVPKIQGQNWHHAPVPSFLDDYLKGTASADEGVQRSLTYPDACSSPAKLLTMMV
jgi:hypothetical protein